MTDIWSVVYGYGAAILVSVLSLYGTTRSVRLRQWMTKAFLGLVSSKDVLSTSQVRQITRTVTLRHKILLGTLSVGLIASILYNLIQWRIIANISPQNSPAAVKGLQKLTMVIQSWRGDTKQNDILLRIKKLQVLITKLLPSEANTSRFTVPDNLQLSYTKELIDLLDVLYKPIEQAETKLAKVSMELQEMKNELKNTTDDLNDLQRTHKKLRARDATHKDQNSDVSQESRRIADLELQLKQIRVNYVVEQNIFHKVRAQVKKEQKETQRQLTDYVNRLNEERQHASNLEREITNLRAQLDDAKHKLTRTLNQNTHDQKLQQKISRLTQELETKIQMLSQLPDEKMFTEARQKEHEARQTLQSTIEQNLQLEDKLKKQAKIIKQLNTRLIDERKEHNAKIKQQREQKMKKLIETIEQQKNQIRITKNKLKEGRQHYANIQTLQYELQELKNQKQETRQAYIAIKSTLSQTRTKVQRLIGEKQIVVQELQEKTSLLQVTESKLKAILSTRQSRPRDPVGCNMGQPFWGKLKYRKHKDNEEEKRKRQLFINNCRASLEQKQKEVETVKTLFKQLSKEFNENQKQLQKMQQFKDTLQLAIPMYPVLGNPTHYDCNFILAGRILKHIYEMKNNSFQRQPGSKQYLRQSYFVGFQKTITESVDLKDFVVVSLGRQNMLLPPILHKHLNWVTDWARLYRICRILQLRTNNDISTPIRVQALPTYLLSLVQNINSETYNTIVMEPTLPYVTKLHASPNNDIIPKIITPDAPMTYKSSNIFTHGDNNQNYHIVNMNQKAFITSTLLQMRSLYQTTVPNNQYIDYIGFPFDIKVTFT